MSDMTAVSAETPAPVRQRRFFSVKAWDRVGIVLLNLFALFVVVVYLFPMTYMLVTAVKLDDQFGDSNAPLYPATRVTYEYQGEAYDLYEVPTDDGTHQLALIEPKRLSSTFIDPANPDAGLIVWEGRWRTLEPVYRFNVTLANFAELWERVDFVQMGWNTVIVTVLSEIGVLISSILVAYGFARFPIPWGKLLFLILIGTIIIPEAVTLVPTYFTYVRVLGWRGTFNPLIVPHLFGNAILIFLMRQNFRAIPREMEEAAMLDGAGSLRILWSVILPQSVPVVITAGLLHFFFAWNDLRLASLYLSSEQSKYTIAFGIQQYQSMFPPPNLLQASALISMVVPVLVLLLTQKYFMRGVRLTGLEK